jgi:MoxR-like ATPase
MARRNINALHRIHKKAILAFLGVELEQIPTTNKDCASLLEAYERQAPADFERAFSIIVDGKVPEGGELQKVITYEAAAKLLRDEIKGQETSTLKTLSDTFKGQAEQLVGALRNEKGVAMKEFNEALQRLENYAVEVIDRESKKFNRIEIKVGSNKPVKLDGVVPEEFPKLIQLAHARKNIMMIGPTGCGKTFIAEKIAEHMSLPFASQSCSAGVSESSFSGWLIPVGQAGKFVYVHSQFVKCYEEGGVFLFDEIDASDANTLVFMNQALANNAFTVTQRHERPLVKKHKDFVCIAAANTNGTGADALYHGRNALDEATMDRFRVGTVMMDYSAQVEEKIIAPEILAWGRKIRNAIKMKNLRRVMSTRTMLDAQDMIKGYDWKMEDVEKGYFASWAKEEVAMLRSVMN